MALQLSPVLSLWVEERHGTPFAYGISQTSIDADAMRVLKEADPDAPELAAQMRNLVRKAVDDRCEFFFCFLSAARLAGVSCVAVI